MPGPGWRLLSLGLLVIAAALLVRTALASYDQLRAPFDLQFETPSLSSVEVIEDGRNPYDPDVYDAPPFVLTMYTPLYHYLLAVLPRHDANPFLAGRVVAGLSLLLAALCLFAAAPRAEVRLAVFALAVYLSFWPSILFGAYLKNDTLALLFSVLAVTLLHRRGGPGAAAGAGLLCFLAVVTKQSYVAAGLSCALFLLLTDRRSFYAFATSGALLSAAFAAFASLVWGPGFWFSTVGATRQEMLWTQFGHVALEMVKQPLFPTLLALTGGLAWVRWKAAGAENLRESPYFLYAAISFWLLLATVGKWGSWINYLLEPLLAMLLWSLHSVSSTGALRPPLSRRSLAVIGGVATACLAELSLADRLDYSWVDAPSIRERSAYYERLRAEVDSLGLSNPSVLSLFVWDDPDRMNVFGQAKTYMLTDHSHLNDSFLYKALWQDGILDPSPMLRSIEDGYFDLIVLPHRIRANRYLPYPYREMMEAIRSHYRLGLAGGEHDYYLPAVEARR